MPTHRPGRTTAELIVQCLENEGVTHVFGVPGEENIRLVDAVSRSGIEYVLTRHEQGASFMAETYGRLTGRAGHGHLRSQLLHALTRTSMPNMSQRAAGRRASGVRADRRARGHLARYGRSAGEAAGRAEGLDERPTAVIMTCCT